MVNRDLLIDFCNETLNVSQFDDYCPNGLQIEGRQQVNKIISGVSANQDLIDTAIEKGADAIFVHHGIFWKNESMAITGYQTQRVKKILDAGMNLFAYHLPLDDHKELGNNSQLASILGIRNPIPVEDSLIWTGEINNTSLSEFAFLVEKKLCRSPQVFGNLKSSIRKVAWCTGGAQKYFQMQLIWMLIYSSPEKFQNKCRPWLKSQEFHLCRLDIMPLKDMVFKRFVNF